jgi:actin-related protein 8
MENKSSETIVIQLGSSTLRVGFGNQMQPYTIPNVIAYRGASPPQPNPPCDAETLFKAYSMVQNYLLSTGFLKNQFPKIVLPNKKKVKKQVEEEDGEAEVSVLKVPEYTDTSHNPSYLVGEEAYNLNPNDNYTKHWPIYRGHFNITPTQSFRTVLGDLERILEFTAVRILKIPRDIFQQFSVVLIIPDAFYKDQVKALVDIILRNLGFRSIFLQQESISALFGAGVPSACVVDIGATHINVICIEEGVLLPKTHFRQYYAGRDIDLLLMRILTLTETEAPDQLNLVELLKKEACRLMQQDTSVEFICKGKTTSLKVLSTSPALIVTGHSLFHTSLLEISSGPPKSNLVLHPILAVDTDDYLDELIESKIEVPPHPAPEKKIFSLDQIIIKSILALETAEIKKKMANCILLTGGGGMFSDLVDILEDRLINRFPEEGGVDRVEVKASIIHSDSDGNKEHIRPDHLMWVGGTVIPHLESAKELWIARARWVGEWQPTEAKEELIANFVNFENPYQLSEMCRKWRRDRPLEGGVRLIREKATFIW